MLEGELEELEELGFIGKLDFIDPDSINPEVNSEFNTLLVDNMLEFLWDYYLPL
jgi:hypothetical protein